jgi:ABC-2 type transport system permease protein
LTLAIILLSFNTAGIIDFLTKGAKTLPDMVMRLYPPAVFAYKAIANYSIINLLLFIILSICLFVLFSFIFSLSYKSICTRMLNTDIKNVKTQKTIKVNSISNALLKKEISRYFSLPIYVLNTGIGAILIIILAISALFNLGGLFQQLQVLNLNNNDMLGIVITIISSCMILTCTTAPSISLEGNTLWIIKSSPISANLIFWSKIKMNLIIQIPSIIISAVIFALAFKFTLLQLLFSIFLPILCGYIIAVIGLYTNLKYPKFDWVNEVTVVKQSISVLISLLIGMLILAFPIIIYTQFLKTVFTLDVFIFLTTGLFLILSLFVTKLFMTKGARLYKKL